MRTPNFEANLACGPLAVIASLLPNTKNVLNLAACSKTFYAALEANPKAYGTTKVTVRTDAAEESFIRWCRKHGPALQVLFIEADEQPYAAISSGALTKALGKARSLQRLTLDARQTALPDVADLLMQLPLLEYASIDCAVVHAKRSAKKHPNLCHLWLRANDGSECFAKKNSPRWIPTGVNPSRSMQC
jgi:hypothetical protein